MRRARTAAIGIIVVLAVALGVAASRFSLAALGEPSQTETLLATKAKHFLVARGSRQGVPNETSNNPGSVAEGDKLYGAECAMCHGMNGRTPTDAGRWMYPRAADLTSTEVQGYSNPELFWIVKNGIRLSGMPAFGKVESDEHIWSLVHYLRSLKTAAGANGRAEARMAP
jgi:mono/diheme cytochrome c family protein